MILAVKNLSATAGNHLLLDNVSFTLDRGETLVLLGESGSGKTLTAMSIMHLLPPAIHVSKQSSILLDNDELLKLPEADLNSIRGRKVGMIFQEPMNALNPVLTIGDQILEGVRLHLGLKGKAAHQRVIELLQEVGLADPEHVFYQYPHQLSGGMRQRVVIAIAITAHPDLLIADEPTSALDVFTEMQILALLKKLQQKFGMAILFITHDAHAAKKLADRVIVLHSGHVIEEASAEQFFLHPQQPYSRQLVDSVKLHVHTPDQPINAELTQSPLLTIQDFCVHFPIHKGFFKRTVGWIKAVDGVNLTLHAGRTLALVGESGCGKTTLARGLLRLIEPSSGEIDYAGINFTHLTQNKLRLLRRDLQIIFQDPYASLNPRMLISDIIAEGMTALGTVRSKQELSDQIDLSLEQVGLPIDCKYRYPHEFSGGQRQRIVIARALAVEPKVIVCDEPTSALDVLSQAHIVDLLMNLQKNLGLSYLFITHNIPLAASIADEIAVMYHGKIVEQAPTAELLKNPQHLYTKTLLEALL